MKIPSIKIRILSLNTLFDKKTDTKYGLGNSVWKQLVCHNKTNVNRLTTSEF